MHPYRFTVQNNGRQIEELGSMAMRDDGEALAFGELIARDLVNALEANSAIAIFKGVRTVGSVRVE